MNSRQKGRVGHQYTEKYLQGRGWKTYTCPHATLQWAGGSSGWKDAFAAPNPDTGKIEGGFDIIALWPGSPIHATLWQVKKTKRNPLTKKLKTEITNCMRHYKFPYNSCFVIWWPDGVGLSSKNGKGPVIWTPEKEEKTDE